MNDQLDSCIDWIRDIRRRVVLPPYLEWPESLPVPSESDVTSAEQALGCRLPASYVAFMRRIADCPLPEFFLIWIGHGGHDYDDLVETAQRECSHPGWPRYALPFFSDGGGNYACFDLRKAPDAELPVLLWDHELHIDPEGELDLDIIAPDFPTWLEESLQEWREVWPEVKS